MNRRVLVRGAVVVVVLWIGGLVVYEYVAPRLERRQTQESLEQQAAAIAAHRETQRAQPPAPPVVPPSSTAEKAVVPAVAWGTYWSEFRGPRRDGHYAERPIRTDWTAATMRPLWRQPVGAGHASFAVANGTAFTIEQRRHQEVVAAYDVRTGRELWTSAWDATFSEHYGGVGPRATPTWHNGTLYALGATGELRALDAADGRVRWRTNILDDAGAANLEWAMAASPLVVGNNVIVVPGGTNGRAIAAYDRETGKVAWSALDDRAAYSSPMRATLAGADQLVVLLAARVVGLSIDGRSLLWEFPWPTQTGINVAQPLIVGENRVFVSSGYGMGAVMLEVGRDGDRFSAREVWRTNRMKNQFTSSVHHQGFIYGLDEAILACIDAATGDVKWKAGRYGHGQVLLAGGHLVVTTEEGELVLVRATPDRHDEIARVPALDGRTWNHPAIADGFLLLRNGAEMIAFDLRGSIDGAEDEQ